VLSQLLELLRSETTARGTRSVADLAHKLDTTPELVEMMLEDLCRLGYLRRVGGECVGKCASCSAADLCVAGSRSKLWTLRGDDQLTTE
jgi:hypothetical protein